LSVEFMTLDRGAMLPARVRTGGQIKSPAGRGMPAGLETGPWGGVSDPGSLQGRERSATDVASVAGYMTSLCMDSS
jgi:hypothetical protein